MSWLRRKGWTLLACAAVAVFVLGIWGFYLQVGKAASLWDAIYFSLRLFTFEFDLQGQGNAPYNVENNWALNLARFLAPLTVAVAVVKGVMLAIAQQVNLWQIVRWRKHAVVCGAGERGRQLALALRKDGRRVVVIESNETADTLADIRGSGARIIIGSATDPATQAAARLDTASTVAAVTPCEESNLQIVLAASRRANGLPLRAVAHAGRSFAEMFESQPPFGRIADGKECGFFDHDAAAARLLVDHYAPLLVSPLLEERRQPVFLLAGDGTLLPELLGVIVTQCQFARAGVPRILCLVTDEAAITRRFPLNHPQVRLVADLTVAVQPLPAILQLSLDCVHDTFRSVRYDLAFVGCREDIDTLALARNLVQQPGRIAHDVVAGLRPSTQLMRLYTGSQPLAGVRSHDLVELGCNADIVLHGRLDRVAREIHERYLADQLSAGRSRGSAVALVSWEELPEGLRQSNRSQADHIRIKQKTLQISRDPATVEALAEAEHRRWMADKILGGWRYALERDDARRLHPGMRPYDELSEDEKQKDRNPVLAWIGPDGAGK